MYYYRSRYYDPVVGKFIGEDAIGFQGGDANLYRYVGNSAVNAIDPFGYRTLHGLGTLICQKPPAKIKPKTPLRKNPDCKAGDIRVPLNRERLIEIGINSGLTYMTPMKTGGGTFNFDLGEQFEDAVLRSTQLPKYTGTAIPVSTGRSVRKAIIPESIQPVLGTIKVKQNGVEIRQTTTYPNSSFFEVKSSGDTSVAPSSFARQAEGYLNAAQKSPAKLAGWVPLVTFITTSDVRIGQKYIDDATRRGVAVRQGQVYESCLRPGFLQQGPVSTLNPEVYPTQHVMPNDINRGWGLSVPFR
jgi:hypothetical protein